MGNENTKTNARAIRYTAEYDISRRTLYLYPLGERTWIISKEDETDFYLFSPLNKGLADGEHDHFIYLSDALAKAETK